MIWVLTTEMCMELRIFLVLELVDLFKSGKNSLNDKEEDLRQFRGIHIKP